MQTSVFPPLGFSCIGLALSSSQLGSSLQKKFICCRSRSLCLALSLTLVISLVSAVRTLAGLSRDAGTLVFKPATFDRLSPHLVRRFFTPFEFNTYSHEVHVINLRIYPQAY